jgi:hypothetical protein
MASSRVSFRNRHVQTILIEAAKMAPRHSPALAMIYHREKQKENANRATLPWRGRWWRTWSPWIAAKKIFW